MNRRETLWGLIAGSAAILRASDKPERLDLGGAHLEIYLGSDFSLGNAVLLDWVRRSARAVMAYFGRFPVAQASLYITLTDRAGVTRRQLWRRGRAYHDIRRPGCDGS
jgi:hypothetical protein